MKNLKIIAAVLLLFNFSLTHAQEAAPELKYNSIRAPANIKIDGKADEWHNKLHAYSGHTQFYYTVSNDDKYLYLTVQTADDYVINRILKTGITFTINKSDQKKDTNAVHITYPLMGRFGIRFKDAPKIKDQSAANIARIDSFANEANEKMDKLSKMIKVKGVKDLDTIISVYNLDGIKAAAYLDHKLRYTYELAVSLQNLGMSVDNPVKFAYQVMINEAEQAHAATPDGIKFTIFGGKADAQYATDFWGEYTLAK